MARVLLVDDDIELTTLLEKYLVSEGFDVDAVASGAIALEKLCEGKFDILVLDVMMPKLDGFEVLKQTRKHSYIPILMLTAKGDDADRIAGLEMGADDYLSKPCNPRELVARIRAILRRVQIPVDGTVRKTVICGDVELNPGKRQVKRNGQHVPLTNTEFDILEHLMRSAGLVVNKEELVEKILQRKLALYDRSMDMHISNLRHKLDPEESTSRIKTVRGIGYVYDADNAK